MDTSWLVVGVIAVLGLVAFAYLGTMALGKIVVLLTAQNTLIAKQVDALEDILKLQKGR